MTAVTDNSSSTLYIQIEDQTLFLGIKPKSLKDDFLFGGTCNEKISYVVGGCVDYGYYRLR